MSTAAKTSGFFIGATFKEAWAIFKEKWQTLLPIMAVPVLIGIASGLVQKGMEGSDLSVLIALTFNIIQMLASMGVLYVVIQVARGKAAEFADITKPLSNAVNYLLASLLYGFIVLLGFICLIIPGIVLAIKYMFVPYLVIDKGLKPMEALKASAKMTDGVKWDLLGFGIAATVLVWLGMLAFFVGLLITGPVAALSYALVYDKLVKRLD